MTYEKGITKRILITIVIACAIIFTPIPVNRYIIKLKFDGQWEEWWISLGFICIAVIITIVGFSLLQLLYWWIKDGD